MWIKKALLQTATGDEMPFLVSGFFSKKADLARDLTMGKYLQIFQ
jgi:ABC-type transporter Mla maintaining outer membrane lipid asymmetry ATPase subunit MlaF